MENRTPDLTDDEMKKAIDMIPHFEKLAAKNRALGIQKTSAGVTKKSLSTRKETNRRKEKQRRKAVRKNR